MIGVRKIPDSVVEKTMHSEILIEKDEGSEIPISPHASIVSDTAGIIVSILDKPNEIDEALAIAQCMIKSSDYAQKDAGRFRLR